MAQHGIIARLIRLKKKFEISLFVSLVHELEKNGYISEMQAIWIVDYIRACRKHEIKRVEKKSTKTKPRR